MQWQGSIDAKGYGTMKQYMPIKKIILFNSVVMPLLKNAGKYK